VFIGGALGAFSRFTAVHTLCSTYIFNNDLSIFSINMLACVLAGVLLALMKGRKALKWRFMRMLFQVGFLGGFSTLAALDLVLADSTRESVQSVKNTSTEGILIALFYLFINIACGVFLCLKSYRKTLRALDDLRAIGSHPEGDNASGLDQVDGIRKDAGVIGGQQNGSEVKDG
jgi:fluoride ion exporter CrcB/FEX